MLAAPLPAACSRLSCCGAGASVRRAFKARRWLWCSSRPNTDRSAAAPQEHQLCYHSGWAAAPPWQPSAGLEPNGARAREPAQRRDWHGVPTPAAPQAVGWGGQCIEGSEQCHPVAAGFGRGSPGGFPRRAAPPRPRQAALPTPGRGWLSGAVAVRRCGQREAAVLCGGHGAPDSRVYGAGSRAPAQWPLHALSRCRLI